MPALISRGLVGVALELRNVVVSRVHSVTRVSRQSASRCRWLSSGPQAVGWSGIGPLRDRRATALLHVAARITHSARQVRLRVDATWAWATPTATGWHRIRTAFD